MVSVCSDCNLVQLTKNFVFGLMDFERTVSSIMVRVAPTLKLPKFGTLSSV